MHLTINHECMLFAPNTRMAFDMNIRCFQTQNDVFFKNSKHTKI